VPERMDLTGYVRRLLDRRPAGSGDKLTSGRGGEKPIAFLGREGKDSEAHENHGSG